MGSGSFFDKIQAKLEMLRLEKRYTLQRNRRSTFVSNAIYVDGEYVFQTPNSTGSSSDSNLSRVDALHGEKNVSRTKYAQPQVSFVPEQHRTFPRSKDLPPTPSAAGRKRLHRFSSLPRFGVSSIDHSQEVVHPSSRRISMMR